MSFFFRFLLLGFLFPFYLWSNTVTINGNLKWSDKQDKGLLKFDGAQYNLEKENLAYYTHQIKLGNASITSARVIDITYEPLGPSLPSFSGMTYVKEDVQLYFLNGTSQKSNYGSVFFVPIVKTPLGDFKKVVSYTIEVKTAVKKRVYKNAQKSFGTSSVLETGEWFKIGVTRDGVFQITYDFLKDLGMDVKNIDPREIKLYGNGGKMLPEVNAAYRPDDLQQNAIEVVGEGDAVFDKEDYILFYGQSPHLWSYDNTENRFVHTLHSYSDTTFYYITASNTGEASKRMGNQVSETTSNITVTSYNDYWYHESEFTNLILSGREWFGESFDARKEYDFVANFPNLVTDDSLDIFVAGVGRYTSPTSFQVELDQTTFSVPFASVPDLSSSYYGNYAQKGNTHLKFRSNTDLVNIKIIYDHGFEPVAWLDKIEINAKRSLSMVGDQLFFRDVSSVGQGVATFVLDNAANVQDVWEITDPLNVKKQSFDLAGGILSYAVSVDSLRSFVALTDVFYTDVYAKGVVLNQNLHAVNQADMVIVSHPLFINQANQLANFHIEEGLSVVVVTPEQVYNEFSSGSQDLVAIRDFVRMLYERASTTEDLPKYLLLIGDGSYDNRDVLANNTNFIPTYQSANSLHDLNSYVSDDYYGILDPAEGAYGLSDMVDVGVGRFPVQSTEEAQNIVDKIINYNTPNTMGDWRNEMTFIGDDEDGNLHMRQADELSEDFIAVDHPVYNRDKIFFDAYQQESTSGGNTYPEVNNAINNTVNQGALIVNYIGHGGEVGWGHERVLTLNDINSWENTNYPLLMTATCEFSRFDDPKRTSAGELTLLNENGAVGLFTTVRVVTSGRNFSLNQDFCEIVLDNTSDQRLGDIFRQTKNLNLNVNTRNFTLLGDPAMRLAYPKHKVVTTGLNGTAVSSSDTLTLSALSKVTVSGEVQDADGQKLSNFSGTIYPTVYDKAKRLTTLNNDSEGAFSFDLQTSKLFKGKVSVSNGEFTFSFVVPKDISHIIGDGKFSYYAENQQEDAHGYFSAFKIGGTAANYEEDEEGPQVSLYMNDENFVFGGITDENPYLLAYVSDKHGINMVGNGIGHDIIAVLDDETENAIVLNDYYEADLDSYEKGTIQFPFKNLKEGRHKLTLKVWDVYNNSSEVTTEFVVVKSQEIKIDRVYNYPNPFTTYTQFWFEHNQPNKQMYVQVQIFTVSGKLVKTIAQNVWSEGYRVSSIDWNGLDEYGDPLGKGVYVYKLRVRASNFSVAEEYQKMVILR